MKLDIMTKDRNFHKAIVIRMQENKCEELILDKFVFLDPFLKKIKKAEEFTVGQRDAYIRKFKGYKHDWQIYKKHKNIDGDPELVNVIDETINEFTKYIENE